MVDSRYSAICLEATFSNSYDRQFNTDIGRLSRELFSPDLLIGSIVPIFSMDGKTPLPKLELMRILSGVEISSEASFSIETGISSGPAAFEDFKEFPTAALEPPLSYPSALPIGRIPSYRGYRRQLCNKGSQASACSKMYEISSKIL